MACLEVFKVKYLITIADTVSLSQVLSLEKLLIHVKPSLKQKWTKKIEKTALFF